MVLFYKLTFKYLEIEKCGIKKKKKKKKHVLKILPNLFFYWFEVECYFTHIAAASELTVPHSCTFSSVISVALRMLCL